MQPGLIGQVFLVERTAQRMRAGWVEGSPKSARSNPDAPLWPGASRWVARGGLGAALDHQSFDRWYFRPVAARVGMGAMRFHDLGHTAASIWLAAGVEIYKVSRWSGNANISTTDTIYAHLDVTDAAPMWRESMQCG